MSGFYDNLVENGYHPCDLDNLSQDQLALLVQEEHIENMWSPEARIRALLARRRKEKTIQKVAKKGLTSFRESKGSPPSYRKEWAKELKKRRDAALGKGKKQVRGKQKLVSRV